MTFRHPGGAAGVPIRDGRLPPVPAAYRAGGMIVPAAEGTDDTGL
jgi:hypothetical protein